MKVNGDHPIDGTGPIGARSRTDRAPAAKQQVDRPGDRLEVSDAARERLAIRDEALRAPDVREALVAQLRGDVESGRYEPDLGLIAARFLEDLGDFPNE
jgi:flagellar biosynthesis anti-sigma factor FlgM